MTVWAESSVFAVLEVLQLLALLVVPLRVAGLLEEEESSLVELLFQVVVLRQEGDSMVVVELLEEVDLL